MDEKNEKNEAAVSSLDEEDDDDGERVVLIVGACGIDRLLTVPTYPPPDSKVRTQSYCEVGGGNAANTATAMARLKDASFWTKCGTSGKKLKIKLLTQLGDDVVGKQLTQHLLESGVELLSSPLFQTTKPGTTTGITTIIVSHAPEHTRTCLHTPGTSGELAMMEQEDDATSSSSSSLWDAIFENVVLFHSDCRHTNVALALAKEARTRGIPVTVDAEKDRQIEAQDELMELATTIFTNSSQLEDYFETRNNTFLLEKNKTTTTKQKHHEQREPLVMSSDSSNNSLIISSSKEIIRDSTTTSSSVVLGGQTNETVVVTETIAKSIQPSLFYLRWYGASQLQKDVLITKGKLGSLHVKPSFTKLETTTTTTTGGSSSGEHETTTVHGSSNPAVSIVDHYYADDSSGSSCCAAAAGVRNGVEENNGGGITTTGMTEYQFRVETTGVMQGVTVADTTGAGDAFIGGYLLCQLMMMDPQNTAAAAAAADHDDNDNNGVELALRFGAWVAGKKLEGPGAQSALPTSRDVDEQLGRTRDEVEESLLKLIGAFGDST